MIEELGHGGMGRVYKVQDTDIKEKIALKLLRPEITLDKEAVERFSNELKLARRIGHRNVCKMFDLGRAEGTTFITMEFVPGEDLKSFIHRSKQLSIGAAISIARQVCEGLEEAHRLGVILYEMVTGRLPFAGETPLSVAHKHKYEAPEDPKKLNTQLPDDLARVILKCLAKDRNERFQSAAELGTELGRIEQGLPTTDRMVRKRKALTSKEITVKFRLTKVLVPVSVFIVLVLAGIILWRVVAPKKITPPPSSSGQPTLAVLYLENKSGDAKLDNWRDGLADAKKYSSEDIEKIAAQTRATHVLRGSFLKAGENFIITAGLQKPGSGETSTALIKRAIEINPEFAMAYRSLGIAYVNLGYISERTRYLQKALELSDRVSERERYLIEGSFYWGNQKTFDKAIQAYQNLLELYPEDSIGNLNLGVIYRDLEQWDKAIEYVEIARRVSPDSIFALGNLARLFDAKGMHDKANAVLDEYSKNNPDNEIIHAYKARNDLIQRRFQSALAEAEKAYFLNPTSSNIFDLINKGDIYCCMDEFANSEIEYARVLDLGGHINQIRAHDRLAALYISAGKYEKSIDQLIKEIKVTQTSGEKAYEPFIHLSFASRNMRSGNYISALKDIDDAWKSADDSNIESSQIMALHLRGVVQARMKSFSEAKQTAVQLEERIGKWFNRKLMRYHDHLLGTIELESENFHKAIEYFDKALSLLPYESVLDEEAQHAFFIDSLARACFQKKDLVRAKKEYEKITQLTTGRLYFGDIYAQSYYMLGRIDEQQGDKPRAIANYRKFLDAWKDADPGLPEVPDARQRLALLEK